MGSRNIAIRTVPGERRDIYFQSNDPRATNGSQVYKLEQGSGGFPEKEGIFISQAMVRGQLKILMIPNVYRLPTSSSLIHR